jgi:hypothetical protein
MYYCYILLDPTKPGKFQYENFSFEYEPFYIGKGKGNRIDSHDKPKDTKTHKRAKIQKIKKLDLEIIKIKLFEDLSESSAFELEKSTISLIGRKDKNEGPLLNLTDGGEGASGHTHSAETKEKRSNTIIEWWILLKEDKQRYDDRNMKISESISKLQKGVSYEERHGDRAEEMKKMRSDWCKENFHKTGLAQMDFKGENNPMFGRSMYDIWLEKYGKEEADRKHSEWKLKKSGKVPHNKSTDKIGQYDKEGNLIKIWEGYPPGFSNISAVLKGERPFANGYSWKYL